jgi:hypothetical protein
MIEAKLMKTIACEHQPGWKKFHDKRFGAATVMPNDDDDPSVQDRIDKRNNGVCGVCFTIKAASGECNC